MKSELLDRVIAVDANAGVPLHTQLRRSLRSMIERHFDDGERFFSESELITHLGISQGTVRRALTDLASEGLIERRVAKGSFVRKTPAGTETRSVGVFVPAFESDFWACVMGHISRGCRDMNAGMVVYHTERGDKLADAFRCLRNPPSQERVIVLGVHEPEDLLRALDDRGYRSVVMDTPVRGDSNFVGVDNAKGVALGLEHLFELGHRDIAFVVNEPTNVGNTNLRTAAYREIMQQRGLEPVVIDCGCELWGNAVEAGYQGMEQVLALPKRPTALFAISDGGAWGILRWCSEHGIRVPTDLSVIGFDDDRPSSFTRPMLSTVAQPVEAIAEAAMRILWDDSTGTRQELLAPTFIVRESAAAPSESSSAADKLHFGLKTV